MPTIVGYLNARLPTRIDRQKTRAPSGFTSIGAGPIGRHSHWQFVELQDSPQQHACQLPQPANFLNGAPIRLVAVSHTGMLARPVDSLCRAQNGEASLALPRMGARQKIDAKQETAINFFMVPPAAKLWDAGILPGILATGFTRSGEQDTSFGRRQPLPSDDVMAGSLPDPQWSSSAIVTLTEELRAADRAALITVWLQVPVLPGPPRNSDTSSCISHVANQRSRVVSRTLVVVRSRAGWTTY